MVVLEEEHAVSRQSLSKAHNKITSREPTFATPAKRFGTDYGFDKSPKKVGVTIRLTVLALNGVLRASSVRPG